MITNIHRIVEPLPNFVVISGILYLNRNRRAKPFEKPLPVRFSNRFRLRASEKKQVC